MTKAERQLLVFLGEQVDAVFWSTDKKQRETLKKLLKQLKREAIHPPSPETQTRTK